MSNVLLEGTKISVSSTEGINLTLSLEPMKELYKGMHDKAHADPELAANAPVLVEEYQSGLISVLQDMKKDTMLSLTQGLNPVEAETFEKLALHAMRSFVAPTPDTEKETQRLTDAFNEYYRARHPESPESPTPALTQEVLASVIRGIDTSLKQKQDSAKNPAKC